MEQEKQVQAVKKALELECLVAKESKELMHMENENFGGGIPMHPSRQIAEKTLPPIVPTVKFNSIIAIVLLILTSGVGTMIYYFGFYKPQLRREIESIKNSEEYKLQCRQAEEKYENQQKEYDEQYEKAVNQYKNVDLPKYEKELSQWTEKHKAEIADKKAALNSAKAQLQLHYSQTKIVPAQYREISALNFIYEMISTSDYTVKEAIEKFDEQKHRELQLAHIREQRQANQLAYEQNQLAYEQNDLLEQQNEISRKARRDANIASAIDIAQHYKTNKILKDKNKK